MDLFFNNNVTEGYKIHSQIARRLTEDWVERNMFCPICGHSVLNHYQNNKPVADFYCCCCHSDFELKSLKSSNEILSKKINDGAYDTMISRIKSYNNPNFFFMNYADGAVNNLWLIPNHFFIPAIIEKRPPLSANAKRAGWTGCNILLSEIPESGKIQIIKNSIVIEKEEILAKYKRTKSLLTKNLDSRGWLMDVLACVERLPNKNFTLNEMYLFTEELQAKHPVNTFIQPKIRQQLQRLRDKGYIEFLDRGHYRKL